MFWLELRWGFVSFVCFSFICCLEFPSRFFPVCVPWEHILDKNWLCRIVLKFPESILYLNAWKSGDHSLANGGYSLPSVTFDSVVLQIYICKHCKDYVWSVHIEVLYITRLYFILYPVQAFASIIIIDACFIFNNSVLWLIPLFLSHGKSKT